jgi:ABC-type nitrate/sulfonate/bicarbonate transport system permease component
MTALITPAQTGPEFGSTAADQLAAARQHGRRRRRRRTLRLGVGVLLLLAAWEATAFIVGDSVLFPTVQDTARTLVHYFVNPYPADGDPMWKSLLISGRRVLLGWGSGVAFGVIVGAAMWSNRLVREIVDPIVELVRPVPVIAFIPLLIVWFGLGDMAKIVMVFVWTVPIMIVSTVSALDAVPAEYDQCARTLGANRVYALLFVQVRAALPGMITGMRLAMGNAWAGIVAVELFSASDGIGFQIGQAGGYLITDVVLAGIVLVGIAGYVCDRLLRYVTVLANPSLRLVSE